MKHYLDIVTISAKIHKRQKRMSVFCIVLAVFLVTTIFGMADMFIRSQILQVQLEDGKYHISVKHITEREVALISKDPGIKSVARYGILNFKGDQDYTLSEKNVAIIGCDEEWVTEMLVDFIVEGVFPQKNNQAMITESAKSTLNLQIGDPITIEGPKGRQLNYIISGFCKNASKTMSEDSYGLIITTDAYRSIFSEVKSNKLDDYNSMIFVQFLNQSNVQKEIKNLKEQFGLLDEQVSENTKLLGLIGQSSSSFMAQVYMTAIVLFILVLFASIMMITSSLNSNVAQRTEFFGLMRCIGATPKQVMRIVRKEALRWCRLAILIGVISGMVVIWMLCGVLRFLSPEYFEAIPVFGISIPSIIAGIFVGILTVFFAARSPAKKASRVSPLAAVSGNANNLAAVKKEANTKMFKIDIALGIHHAKASRKNLFLMTGSFALSIILFLSFSVTIDFMNHTLTPLRPWTADLSIISPDNTCSIDKGIMENLRNNPVVKSVYGRMFVYNLPVTVNSAKKRVDLISYEQKQFKWAKEYLLEGSVETVQNEINTGLIVYEPQNTIQIGDSVKMNIGGQNKEIKIVGMLSACPFNNAADVGTIICSEETFQQVTGNNKYTIIDVQLTKHAKDSDVDGIHKEIDQKYTFSDERMGNSSTLATYYCFWLFDYGFLVLIALIAIFNVINSIAMSVSSRTKQYGAFRAIGLSYSQLTKMIVAEATTYTVIGNVIGTIVGIICNKVLYDKMIHYNWGDIWAIPWKELGIIIFIMILAVLMAVRGPIKKFIICQSLRISVPSE